MQKKNSVFLEMLLPAYKRNNPDDRRVNLSAEQMLVLCQAEHLSEDAILIFRKLDSEFDDFYEKTVVLMDNGMQLTDDYELISAALDIVACHSLAKRTRDRMIELAVLHELINRAISESFEI